MSSMLLLIVPYVSLIVFIIGLIYRGQKIAGMPVHLRWELAPVPHEKGKSKYGGSYLEEFEWWTKPREKSILNELWYMFQEIIFLKGVWEHKRSLWIFSFPFHFGGFYLLAGVAGLTGIGAILQLAGSTFTGLHNLIQLLAIIGYIAGCIGSLGLLYRRVSDPNIRPFTTFSAIFNLFFLFLIFGSGIYAISKIGDYPAVLIGYIASLLTFNTSVTLPSSLALHVVLASLFLIYLPFTYMMHFVAKYFTYHEIRWNDEPLETGSPLEKKIEKLMGQKVTWAAPHIKGEGKKTWVDIATEEVNNAKKN